MNRPIPALTAAYNSEGIDAMIHWRTPVTVRIRNATPERNTAPSAVCQGTPMPFTTVYVKYAFRPMPGASAIG